MAIPTYDNLFNPLLEALHKLGGSAAISEMEDEVAKILNLTEAEINELWRKGNITKLGYRLAWARNYLKRYGLLENSSRGVWALTAKGKEITSVNKDEVNKYVKQLSQHEKKLKEEADDTASPEDNEIWEDQLLKELMQMSPQAFERLCQRILRESGFVQVEVTGRSGDGGIDGKGIIRLGGLLSFHIIFQCKRYEGSVPSKQIRDFRGAMVGRADKGLFITTGTFTRDARAEATRDGAPPIDLIDGDQLVEKMKELELGVNVKKEDVVSINKDWFKNF